MTPSIQLKQSTPLFVAALQLACFGLWSAPKALGVVPAPDGGYPGGNTAEGQAALLALTNGTYNTAIGFLSLRSNVAAKFNTGVGAGTLLLTTADNNTAVGAGALLSNTTGPGNTATGAFALFSNTIGNGNTAVGDAAMQANTEGNGNTGIGTGALELNNQGDANTALGVFALGHTTSDGNTAVGALALQSNQTGVGNNAFGQNALGLNVSGSGNNGFGTGALFGNHGNFNTAMGDFALTSNDTGSENVGVGRAALSSNTSGGGNVAIGSFAGAASTTGNNNVYIGLDFGGIAGESDHTYIRNISTNVVDGLVVNVDGASQLLGHASSSRRYKEQIKPMDKASHDLYRLKPVTFRFKEKIDRTHSVSFGLIAEEVADVNPDLVVRNAQGQPESVRYDAVNAMLLNEFLKEHRKNEEQEATILRLQKQVEALSADLQKMNARLAATSSPRDGLGESKSAPQVVEINQ